MPGLTLLRVVSNADLDAQERRQQDADLEARQQSPLILGLAAYLRECWDAAQMAKRPIETVMLKAMRQRNGEYEPEKLNAIRAQGGSEVYMMLTEIKCRAAESWLRDILMDQGTPPWDLQATPIPDLSPTDMEELKQAFAEQVLITMRQTGQAPTKADMMELKEVVAQQFRFKLLQTAQNRVERMKTKIEDQLVQGGWSDAFNEFITDLATFPCAFIKGPIVRRQRYLKWNTSPEGRTTVEPGERIAPEYERVSPFNIYPEPGVTRINDGYLFEHHELTRQALADLIGVPGYDEQAIRKALENGPQSSWVTPMEDDAREEEERKFYTEMRPTDVYDAIEFWGKVSGKMLREWGMTPEEIPDEAKEYDANVWMVGTMVIKAVLNYDPLGEKPYAKTSFIKTPGSFWGRSIPEIIEDLQNICNAAARALVNNMGIASGPQVELNLERLPPNEEITTMHPWKIWQVLNDPLGSSAPAIRFNQPTDNSGSLMAVYEKFSRLADDHSGIPSYIYGDTDVQGAGRTASGLSMLMGSAGKGIRQVVMHIDHDVVKPIIHRQFVYNMRYDDDESIKGDAQIIPRGAVNLAVKETTNVRRVEFLNATANEIDMGIIGPDGRAAILREIAKGLQMPVDEVVPSRENLAAKKKAQERMAMQQIAAQGGMGGTTPPGQQPAAQQLDPGGAPPGGTNLVANPQTGQ
ncbi:MAG: hypothetical protein ABFE08_17815 [Armatimonadia bacterium]